MKFDTVFRGYDKKQVDAYIKQTEMKYDEILRTQKERIFQLVDDNSVLVDQVKQYMLDEQAISKSLIESQRLAKELTGDAEKFAQIVLNRAKIFYATWQAYSKTLLSSLSGEEIKQFNILSQKIEKIINDFEGSDVAATLAKVSTEMQSTPNSSPHEFFDAKSKNLPQNAAALKNNFQNPVDKIVKASGGTIDMTEMLKPDKTLEELCAELGLLPNN